MGRYAEERAAVLPQVTATGTVGRSQDETQLFVPGPQDVRAAGIALSQPLYTWGQVGAAIRAARYGILTAADELRIARQAVYRDVSATFYDVLLAKELNRIAAQNLEQKILHQDEARRKLAAGVATEYDLLAAEVGVENARPELIRTGISSGRREISSSFSWGLRRKWMERDPKAGPHGLPFLR